MGGSSPKTKSEGSPQTHNRRKNCSATPKKRPHSEHPSLGGGVSFPAVLFMQAAAPTGVVGPRRQLQAHLLAVHRLSSNGLDARWIRPAPKVLVAKRKQCLLPHSPRVPSVQTKKKTAWRLKTVLKTNGETLLESKVEFGIQEICLTCERPRLVAISSGYTFCVSLLEKASLKHARRRKE